MGYVITCGFCEKPALEFMVASGHSAYYCESHRPETVGTAEVLCNLGQAWFRKADGRLVAEQRICRHCGQPAGPFDFLNGICQTCRDKYQQQDDAERAERRQYVARMMEAADHMHDGGGPDDLG